MENKKYELSSIDGITYSTPAMYETFSRNPWVNYGENNVYPVYLIEQYNNCAIHKAVINAKRELTCGDGLICPANPMAVVIPVNNKEMVEDVFRKCALDYILFGGFALNVIWSRDKKSIAEFYHIDFSRIRSGKINADDEVTEYFYSPDWSNTRKFPPQKYDAFSFEKGGSQIYYHFEYSPNNTYYPLPDYSGGLAAINIDIQIKNFHNNNLRNGFAPSLFINFTNGVPSTDEAQEIKDALQKQYGSSYNAGKPIVNFSESKESSPEVTQIGTNSSDNYYASLYSDINKSILSSHRVSSPELFGVPEQGKLGTGTEIIEHSTLFLNTVIKPYIKQLLPVFNKVMSLKTGQPIKLEVKPLTILELIDKVAENVE